MAGGYDVSQAISSQNNLLLGAQQQVASDYSQVNQAGAAIINATKAAGLDTQTIDTQKAQGLLDAQDAAQRVATSYGGNPNDVSFIMTQLGAQWQQTEAARLDAEKVVQQKQSVSFLDDPLTWLSNKLTVNTDINNYNNLNQQSDDLFAQMKGINDLNTSTAESMRSIATTQTAGTVAATSDLAAQQTAIDSAKAQLQSSLYNAAGVKAVTDLSQDSVDNVVKGAQTAIAAGHLAVAQQQASIMQAELNQKTALYAQEVKDKQQADASDAQMLQYTNVGRSAMGLPALADSTKLLTFIKMGGPEAEAIKQQMTSGAMSSAIGGKPVIAATAGTSARLLANSGSPLATSNPAMKPVIDLLSNSYTEAKNPQTQAALGINNKDLNSVDSGISSLVNNQVVQMAGNIKTGDASNIFQAPPLTALASMASVKSNPLYTSVLEPQVKAGMTETDPNKLLMLTSAAVEAGQISVQDAANGMSALFRSAIALNTETKDYMRVGITPQTSYNTTLQATGTFGGSSRIDMTNAAQVTTALMKQLAITRQTQSIGLGLGN